MRGLTEQVLNAIRKHGLFRAGDRVAVAVSGGADSVALLMLLVELRQELGIVLSVAHVNHKLRGAESDEDEKFVADLACQHKLELFVRAAPVQKTQGGLEAEARKQRYEFFLELTQGSKIGKIATAHTLDDQAETVLLRIFRGTGIRGLGGIHPRLKLQHFKLDDKGQPCGEVIRPLLGIRREQIREFLREHGQPWREDSSNQDPIFLRNKLRMAVLPGLRETFGEAAFENLADLAEIARAEDEALSQALAGIHNATALDLRELFALSLAARRRATKAWIEATAPDVRISFRLIEEVLDLAHESGGKLDLAPGHTLRITQNELRWEPPRQPTDYEYALSVPGAVELPELNLRIESTLTPASVVPQAEHQHLVDPEKLRGELRVRNWRPGDRFWPANRKEPKKVKELLSDRHVVGVEKTLWPVVESGGELIWLRGFAAPQALQPPRGAQRVLWIHEIPGPPHSTKQKPRSGKLNTLSP